ncbi:MAG: PTS glucose transporter subunit IIA [Erysipelotrichaceae bacterium]|nr:PTS glucose transporter subunit IIA [Erysipelotrichaceae bacterium]
MGIFNKKTNELELYCPISGNVKDISEAPDEVFAKKMMGDGVIIEPTDGKLYAPCDGVISMIFPTKHAIGIRLANKGALLIHFGVDTVNLGGKGFSCSLKLNQRVKKGDLLLNADIAYIRANAISDCVIMALSELPNNVGLRKNIRNNVTSGDPIIKIG